MSTPTPLPTTPARAHVSRGTATAGLATSMFLVVLDAAMANIAGPAIRDGLGLSAAELTVVATSYLVPYAGLLLLGGRLTDVLGGRRVFLVGMACYVAASAVCALAADGSMLVAGRIGQGVGAAIVVPSALALALALHPSPAERTRVVGIWGAVAGSGSLLGVGLGGMLTQVLGWQSVFFAPVPFGIASALVVVRSVPALPGTPGRFDFVGAVAITAGISAVAFGMVSAAEAQWSDPGAFVAIAVGLAFLVAFVVAEHRSTHPLVPPAVFRRGPVARSTVIVVLMGATLSSMFFFLPQYSQGVLGMDPLTSGLALIPIALMIIVGSVVAPLVARRIGLPRALSVGLVLLLVGFVWLTLNPVTDGFSVHLVGAFVLIGAGTALALVNAIAMAVRDGRDGESGLLSGLVTAGQQVGAAVGVATLSGIAIGAAGAQGEIEFTAAFTAEAALVLVALLLSLVPANRTQRHPGTTATR